MKKILYWLSSLVLAGWTLGVHAQDIWAYEVIGPNNQAKLTFKPPVDLTFPPTGMTLPIVTGNDNRGVVLTPREEAERRRAPHLIIMLIPAQLAERTSATSR